MLLRLVHAVAPDARVLVTRATDSGGKNKKKACVVLLGWGGSKARHLTRVRSFYEKDCEEKVDTVISFTMPLLAPELVRKVLIKQIVDEIPASGDVLVHSFSNNGMWAFGEICEEIENRNGKIAQPKRLIVDSAPAFFYEKIGIVATAEKYQPVILSTLLNRDQYRHPILTPILKSLLIFFGVTAKFLYLLPGGASIVPDLISRSVYLRDKCPPLPSLFLYGGEDRLIPEYLITDYIDALKKRYDENHTPIQIVKFERAKHVSSFWDKETRNEYRTIVKTFLKH